jgi:hypothetical protein
MIKAGDLRIGDLVRVSRECAFPKGTMCVVTNIVYEKTFGDKIGIATLSAMNGDFDKYGSSAAAYAWFIWEKGYKGETTVKWFN